MAQSTVPDLLASPGVERVGIAGRRADKAKAVAKAQSDDRAVPVAIDAKDAGVTCVLGIGSTPGTMNVLGMYGASKLDRVHKIQLRSSGAVVSGGDPGTFVPPYAIRTILDEFSMDAPILRKGEIQFVPALSGLERSEFMAPVGVVEGYYTIHSELATMPTTIGKGVQEMDFIVAFPPAFRETIATLVRLGHPSRDPLVPHPPTVRQL